MRGDAKTNAAGQERGWDSSLTKESEGVRIVRGGRPWMGRPIRQHSLDVAPHHV